MHNSAAPTSATATCSPTAPAVSAAAIEPAQRRRAIVATVIGNGLEWFDFTVYSFFAIIIAKLFFPTGNDLSSLLLAVATLAWASSCGLSAASCSALCDRVGRKAALSMTILLMALGTTLIGIAPTYDQVGIFAPLMIVVARCCRASPPAARWAGPRPS